MSKLVMTTTTATPVAAKGQTSDNRDDLDNERNYSPVSPAVRSPGGKMQPAL